MKDSLETHHRNESCSSGDDDVSVKCCEVEGIEEESGCGSSSSSESKVGSGEGSSNSPGFSFLFFSPFS